MFHYLFFALLVILILEFLVVDNFLFWNEIVDFILIVYYFWRMIFSFNFSFLINYLITLNIFLGAFILRFFGIFYDLSLNWKFLIFLLIVVFIDFDI